MSFSTTERRSSVDVSRTIRPDNASRFANSTAVLWRILSRSASRPTFAAGWRRYLAFLNHQDTTPTPDTPSHEEIIEALNSIDSFVDVTEDDLIRLSQILAEKHRANQSAPS